VLPPSAHFPAHFAARRTRAFPSRVVTDLALDMRVRFGSALAVAILAVFASFAAAADSYYFWNTVTHATQWEDPGVPVGHEDPKTGKTFYVDDSGESVWEYPGVWREVESKEHGGRVYFFNKETGESVWEQPEELAWKRVKVDPSEL